MTGASAPNPMPLISNSNRPRSPGVPVVKYRDELGRKRAVSKASEGARSAGSNVRYQAPAPHPARAASSRTRS